jgi:signal transduction histidine kinase
MTFQRKLRITSNPWRFILAKIWVGIAELLFILVGAATLRIMFFHETLQRQPAWLVLLAALGLVGLIGGVDHVTGWEWSCFAPYAVPIVLVSWKMGKHPGFVFAFLCAATYWVADRGNNPYQTHWGFALAVVCWWFYFSVLVVAAATLKTRRELDRVRIKTLERMEVMERQILQTTEREQQRIGRDLHDSLSPQLAAIRIAATLLTNELRQRGQPEAIKADQICQLAGDAGLHARDLARGIFPVQMDGSGLATALKALADTTSQLTSIPVAFYEMGEIWVEDPAAGMHLYRIAQEAVNNATKHGDPRKITIALNQIQDALRLTIADDGKGMALAPAGTQGMGLDSMRYRARVLGGELKIDSNPGEGFIVSCEIPNSSPFPVPPAS